MTGIIPALQTPEQELHGPIPISVPGWEFKSNELYSVTVGPGKSVSIKTDPFLFRRRVFAYLWITSGAAGWFNGTITIRFKGTSLFTIPFGFGLSNLSVNGQSSGTLLGSGSIPTASAFQLNLSPPLIGSESNPVYLYPLEISGLVDEITWTLGTTTQVIAQIRMWLGCISQS